MTQTSAASSITQSLASHRAARGIGLVPFIPAGYPDLTTTRACLAALQDAGASVIEIGFPFSDPIADGPTIQSAFVEALSRKLKVQDIFAAIRECRLTLRVPLVSMVSYSLVYRYGTERFFRDGHEAGFSGLILPDLPPPEAQAICDQARSIGLDTILLVAPSTPPQRRGEIVKLCSGFVYYLSVAGITGPRDRLPEDLERNVRELKSLTNLPVCVGFGISQPRHLAQLSGVADGAIVGSALVKIMTDHHDQGAEKIAAAVGDYCRSLLEH